MKTLLTHSYYLYEDPKEMAIMKPYVPLGLLYISSYFDEHNLAHEVYDTTFSSQQDHFDYIFENKIQIVAIYTNLMTKIKVIELINELKSNPKYENPILILGGPDITFNLENYLNTGADYLVIGEGEQTLFELIEALKSGSDIHEIDGLAFLKKNEVVKTNPRVKIRELKDLNFPNRNRVPIEKYLKVWKDNHGLSSINVSTQRGCPYTCKWCSTAVYGQSYRRRPAQLVVEELIQIKKEYNPDNIWFVDDVFTVSHKWLKEFHQALKEANLKIRFECITRAERLTNEVLDILKDSGCFRIWIGAESGSQKIIDEMDRRVDINVVKEAIIKTNQLGIETGTFIMVGYPKEDVMDIKQTVKYLKEANPTHFTITVAYPIKGTQLYKDIESKIIHQPEWNISTDREIDFSRTYTRKFYDYAVEYIVNEVLYDKEKNNRKHRNWKTLLKLKLKSIKAKFNMHLEM